MAPDGHLTDEDLDRLRSRTLPPERLIAIDAHLGGCSSCREALARAAGPTAIPRVLGGSPAHLDYERLAAYVDGTLPDADRAAAERHLKGCSRCRTDLADLRAFDATPSAGPIPARSRPALPWRPVLALSILAAAVIAVPMAALLHQSRGQVHLASREASQLRAELALRDRTARELRAELDAARAAMERLRKPEASPQGAGQGKGGAAPAGMPTEFTDGGIPLRRDEQGRLVRIVPLPPVVHEIVRGGSLELPKLLAELITVPETVRGVPPAESMTLLGPSGTVVQDDRPLLRWTAVPGAEHYEVVVADRESGPPHTSGPLTATEWRVSSPLTRGRDFEWQVTAKLRDGESVESPSPRPRFLVLDEPGLRRVESFQRTYAGSTLTLGIFYAREGLLAEAERELRVFRDQNPKALLPRRLLTELSAAMQGKSPLGVKQ